MASFQINHIHLQLSQYVTCVRMLLKSHMLDSNPDCLFLCCGRGLASFGRLWYSSGTNINHCAIEYHWIVLKFSTFQ